MPDGNPSATCPRESTHGNARRTPRAHCRMATSTSSWVGAGIVGMTTALLLQQACRDRRHRQGHVALDDDAGEDHGRPLHSEIDDKRGFDAAKVYAQAKVAGFDNIFDNITEFVRTLDLDSLIGVDGLAVLPWSAASSFVRSASSASDQRSHPTVGCCSSCATPRPGGTTSAGCTPTSSTSACSY